jgi:transposase
MKELTMPPMILKPQPPGDCPEAYGGTPHERWRGRQMLADPRRSAVGRGPAGRSGAGRTHFIPAPEVRACRSLALRREAVVKDRAQLKREIHRLLDAAGIPLGGALDDLFGVTGMAILERIGAGEVCWRGLPALLKGRAGRRLAQVRTALVRCLDASGRARLQTLLGDLARAQEQLRTLDEELERRLSPFAEVRSRLVPIPGIAQEGASLLLAHLGPDLTAFPDGDHFAAWIGLCPGGAAAAGAGPDPGAGLQPEAGTGPAQGRAGNGYLQGLFTQFAHAAVRTKGSWLQQKYLSLRDRMVWQKAIIAIAHKLAVIVFKVIRERVDYRDRSKDYVPSREKKRAMRRAAACGQGA